MKSLFGWLNADREIDNFSTESNSKKITENIKQNDKDKLLSEKNTQNKQEVKISASMEILENYTIVEETEDFKPIENFISDTYIQQCEKCNLLFFTKTESICLQCKNSLKMSPESLHLEADKKFTWDDDWNPEEEFSKDEIPNPTFPPEPYVLKKFNLNICKKLPSVEISNITAIDWNKVTKG